MPDVHEVIAVIMAEEQCAEVLTCVSRFGVAPDHELLAKLDLELEPVARPDARVVSRVGALRDDAFPVVAPRAFEEPPSAPRCRVAEPNAGRWRGADEALEPPAARRPWFVEEDVVAIDEQVERHERRRRRLGVTGDVLVALQVHAALKRLKACRRVAREGDDLAVEHEWTLAASGELSDPGRHLRELTRLVFPVPGDEPHAVTGRECENTDPVVLGL